MSPVLAEAIEDVDGIVPSHDPFDDCTEFSEALRVESPLAAARFKAGNEGFLKTPPSDARSFDGLLATVFEPALGSPPYVFFPGLGVLVSAGAAIAEAGSFEAVLSETLDAVFRTTGV